MGKCVEDGNQPKKLKVMHVGKQNPGLPYYINGTEIALVTTEKDIGFWIRDDLSTLGFKQLEHIENRHF